MKKFFLFLFILLIGVGVFAAFGVVALTQNPIDDWQGTVELQVLNAEVSVKQGNLDYQEVADNMILEEGDMIKTDLNGEAEILIGEGSVIRLSPNTEITINASTLNSLWEQDVNVSVNKGKIWFRILKIFDKNSVWEVETPNVVATVRGTAFGIEVLDNDEMEVFVAESEVVIENKNDKMPLRKAIAVAGQKMSVNKNFKVIKDKLLLNDEKSVQLQKWLKKNLESDRSFQNKAQQKINAKLLQYLNKKPGTLMHEAQMLAEDLKYRFVDSESRKKLEVFKEKRRMAEVLWLAEKGDSIQLQQLLDKTDLQKDNNQVLDKISNLFETSNNNIKRVLPSKNLDDKVFDLKTLEKKINNLELQEIPESFNLNNNFEDEHLIDIQELAEVQKLDKLIMWLKDKPEFADDLLFIEKNINLIEDGDIKSLLKFLNSLEYLQILRKFESLQQEDQDLSYNIGDNEILIEEDPKLLTINDLEIINKEPFWDLLAFEYFKDIDEALRFINENIKIKEQIEIVSEMSKKVNPKYEREISEFLNSSEYLQLADMLYEVPGYEKPQEIEETQTIELDYYQPIKELK